MGSEAWTEERFRELERKRDTEGLSHEEANELGRMVAEKEGRPYASADDRSDPEAGAPDEERPASESQLAELRERPETKSDEG